VLKKERQMQNRAQQWDRYLVPQNDFSRPY